MACTGCDRPSGQNYTYTFGGIGSHHEDMDGAETCIEPSSTSSIYNYPHTDMTLTGRDREASQHSHDLLKSSPPRSKGRHLSLDV